MDALRTELKTLIRLGAAEAKLGKIQAESRAGVGGVGGVGGVA